MTLELYDSDDDSSYECFECGQKEAIIDNVKYWLESVIDHLYANDADFLDDFERCLDELVRSVNMKLPQSDLKLQPIATKNMPKKIAFEEEISYWKTLNYNHLKQIQNHY